MDPLDASRRPRAPRGARRRRRSAETAARRRQAVGARADRSPLRSRHLRRSRQARHPPLPRLRHGRADRPRRRRRRRRGPGRGPPGLRLRAGLHRLRRVAVGDQRRQDRQDHGSGDEDGRAGRRPERLGRRAHPGRRALARRLRRHLPAQHARLGRHPADLGDHGPVRRRRGLFAGDHRLQHHGRGHELHVRDRPGRAEDGDARGSDQGGARRRQDAQRDERRRALLGPRRSRVPAAHSRAARLSSRQQPRRRTAARDERPDRPRGRGARPARAGVTESAVRHARPGARDRR